MAGNPDRLFVAGNTANLIAGRPLDLSLGFMAANLVESLACAWLISSWCGPEVRFKRIREVLALVVAAVFVNAGSAVIGAGTAALTGRSAFKSFWFTWWIVDGLGILLITPLIVTWSDFRDRVSRHPLAASSGVPALVAVLSAAGWSAFHNKFTSPVSPRPYMVIGVLAWCGLRFGQRTVTLVLVALAAFAVTSRAINLEPFVWGRETPQEQLLTIQVYLAVVGSSGLLLAAAYAEAKAAEAHVRAVGDNLPEGAVYQLLHERDGSKRFLYLSAGIEKLTGVPAEEILRDHAAYYSLLLDEDRLVLEAADLESTRDWKPFRAVYRLRRRDGEVRWFQATSSPRKSGEGRIVWDGILADITERKQGEDDLRASEARFRTLIEDAPIAIAVARNRQLVYASPTLRRMFGFEDHGLLDGPSIFEFFAARSREEIAQRAARRQQGFDEPREYESVGVRADGSEFPILLAVSSMQLPEGQAVVAFVTDLTSTRHSEEERSKLEQQLRQAQKLESIGRLAGGVAHDFNNLLTVINGFSTLLTQKLDSHSRLWAYADQVRKSGERGASLTRQLLAFSRQEVIKPVPLNLNRIIADSAPMVRSLMGEDISLATSLDPGLAQVLADPAQIDQVILNLAANARDAMPHGGRLEIATRNVETDPRRKCGTLGDCDGHRYGSRHGRGYPAAHFRTVFHHQGCRKRHRAGISDGLWRDAAERRMDRRKKHGRRRHFVRPVFPSLSGAGPHAGMCRAGNSGSGPRRRTNSSGGRRRRGTRLPTLGVGRLRVSRGGGARRAGRDRYRCDAAPRDPPSDYRCSNAGHEWKTAVGTAPPGTSGTEGHLPFWLFHRRHRASRSPGTRRGVYAETGQPGGAGGQGA